MTTHHGALLRNNSPSTGSGQISSTNSTSSSQASSTSTTPEATTTPTVTPDVTPTVIPPVITPPANITPTYTLGTTTLKLGSKGTEVTELQRFLNNALNINLTLDGKLGKKTITYIKAWQKTHGLVVDGIVGKRTRERMMGGI